jgi:hypothetical protein
MASAPTAAAAALEPRFQPLGNGLPLFRVPAHLRGRHFVDAAAIGGRMRVILAVAQYADEVDRQPVEEPEQLFVGDGAFLDAIRHDAEAAVTTAHLGFQQELGDQPRCCVDIRTGTRIACAPQV